MRGLRSSESPRLAKAIPFTTQRSSSPACGPLATQRGARLLRCGAMDLPAPLKGLAVLRFGIGVTAITTPSLLAAAFGLPAAGAKTPAGTMWSAFFGFRELALVGITAGATTSEPRGLRRLLVVCAATDALDLPVVGIRSIRQPALRRAVLLFARRRC